MAPLDGLVHFLHGVSASVEEETTPDAYAIAVCILGGVVSC